MEIIMTAGIPETRFQAFSGGSTERRGLPLDNDVYYLKKISLSLEKTERHLAEMTEVLRKMQNKTTEHEDRNEKKEEEE